MAFKKLIKRTFVKSSDIMISFTGRKTVYANVYIGEDIIKKLNWNATDKICVFFDEDNPFSLMLCKSSIGDKDGYKLTFKKYFKLQFKFSEVKIKKGRPRLSFNIEDENIFIMINK